MTATVKTLAQFRREVERQARQRWGVSLTWELSERMVYPTGMKGFRGEFSVTGHGRYMALFDMPTGGAKHTLTVRPL
jgi:hypothetical protein